MHDFDDFPFDAFDDQLSPKPNSTDFDIVVETVLSRRGFLAGFLTFGAGLFVRSTSAQANISGLSFDAVKASTADTITVPAGFEWDVVIQWGDPLWSETPEFDETTRGTAASQSRSFGDNNDGMALFDIDGHTVLVANNEYANRAIIWGNRASFDDLTDDDLRKSKMAHGVSIVELTQKNDKWSPLRDSAFNRRITPDTEMAFTGPAAGHDLLKTNADPSGTRPRGTWNNCGNGKTPWGTYLACEENFNGYFSAPDVVNEISAAQKRYGIRHIDWGYKWAKIDDRFDLGKNPNEPNRVGYVVEIDPSDPTSTPKKHTALGRFKHENADLQIAKNGRVVVYMGDDERGEFLYRYVSNGTISNASDLLTNGTLFAARFNESQCGEWLALTPETTGLSKAEICIHTRLAASFVGATTMDRPEWVASNPNKVESYVALTNNKHRGKKTNAGGDTMPVDGPNPRRNNRYGQILRWIPDNEDHATDTFSWNLFALAGNPTVHKDAKAGSANITATNMFNSPDGLSFDSNGLLWIQTDGKTTNSGDFAKMGNNQMLVGDPVTGEIRRFLTGPNGAEISGLTWSQDQKTAFVGIQHPGANGDSSWPGGGHSVPRSAVVAIRRKDGQPFG